MEFSSLLLMRHEIVLLAITLLLVIAEIFIPQDKKHSIVHLAIFLFGIHTILGFLPTDENNLFGGMFRTTGLIHFFKNVLNIGVLILLLQSGDWLQERSSRTKKGNRVLSFCYSPHSWGCIS